MSSGMISRTFAWVYDLYACIGLTLAAGQYTIGRDRHVQPISMNFEVFFYSENRIVNFFLVRSSDRKS